MVYIFNRVHFNGRIVVHKIKQLLCAESKGKNGYTLMCLLL